MDCDENHLPLRDLLERKDKDIPKMNDMTDETKGDVMTLDQVLETLKARDLIAEANWIRARLATQSAKRVDEDTTRDQRILIRLAWLENSMPIDVKEFAADVRAALEADRAVRGVVVPREVDLGDAPKGWRNYEAACWATGWNACREVMLTQGPELGVGADVSGKVLSRLRDVLGTDGTVYRDVAALLAQGQRVARDGLTNLYESASKGFHTSETCGPEGKYLHVSKFRTLEDLHAFSDAWTKTMLVQREAVGDK